MVDRHEGRSVYYVSCIPEQALPISLILLSIVGCIYLAVLGHLESRCQVAMMRNADVILVGCIIQVFVLLALIHVLVLLCKGLIEVSLCEIPQSLVLLFPTCQVHLLEVLQLGECLILYALYLIL